MYAVIRTEEFPEDGHGPRLDPDISVILFRLEEDAERFIDVIPPSPLVKFHMLQPDESYLAIS